jgi:hypothetical protein
VAKDPDGVAWAGPTVVALSLLAAAVAVIVLLLQWAPAESFAPDHGVAASDEEWVRCAAETIERHPGPFAAQSGFEIEEVGHRRLLVRSALLTTDVQLVEGALSYWRFKGWHAVFLDCPEVRLGGTEPARRGRAATGSATGRPCSAAASTQACWAISTSAIAS